MDVVTCDGTGCMFDVRQYRWTAPMIAAQRGQTAVVTVLKVRAQIVGKPKHNVSIDTRESLDPTHLNLTRFGEASS